jgi:predicted nuclease of predicted toxin-antitoxin system
VKLLLDQNLSHRILRQICDLYPDSAHVRDFGMSRSPDEDVWQFARSNGFVIVSKDTDFLQRSLLQGHPPKMLYLRLGNCSTSDIVSLLRLHHDDLALFEKRVNESIMILP